MAAAARRPAPPIYMFNRYADMSQLTDEPGEGWTMMECDSKKACGCGENIKGAVKGLALYARLGEDRLVTSSLAIRMTDEALGRFERELELDIHPAGQGFETQETTAWAKITMHAEELTIISLNFKRRREIGYHLVYDHKRASLSIINLFEVPALMLKPVPRRTCNGDYEIFYMAFDRPFSCWNIDPAAPLLCVFSSARAAAAGAANPAASAWEMWRKVRWSVPQSVRNRYRPDLTFSFQGKIFWADLSQGLVYCDLDDSAAGEDSVVDFGYIELPHGCVLPLDRDDDEPMEATRTMGCDRDSIWFLCIDETISDNFSDNLVSIWTLKQLLGGGEWQWKNEATFSLRDLWRFDGFKESGLRKALVGYPLLNAADGVLYLVLLGNCKGPDAEICRVDHMCSFDIRSKKLLWHGLVHDFWIADPAAFPSRFFQKERAHYPAAGLALLLLPRSKDIEKAAGEQGSVVPRLPVPCKGRSNNLSVHPFGIAISGS